MTRARSVIALVLLLAGCGHTLADHADHALSVAFAATQAASESFTSWDADHQKQLVDTAVTKDAGALALATYRAKRDKVVRGFAAADAAIAACAAALPLARSGTLPADGLRSALEDALAAALEVKAALTDLKGSP